MQTCQVSFAQRRQAHSWVISKHGAKLIPVLFWQGQKVKENTSVKSKSRWTPGMNYILLACSDGVLLQVFQWDFLKAWAHFLTVHWAKERRACRNVLLEISIKGDFSKLLGQTFDWLSAVNRAKTRLKVLIHLSTEKKKADRSSARWHVHSESRDLFRLCVTLWLQKETYRASGEWDAGNLASWQQFNAAWSCKESWDLTSLQKGQNPCEIILVHFKIKWMAFSSGAVQKIQIQLVPSYMSTDF